MHTSPTALKSDQIEALRFIAALAVVCVHIPTLGYGNFGVDIFFIISGMVMMLSTRNSADQFFLKRVIRIVPTYYFFTICVFFLAMVAPSLLQSTTADIGHLIQSLLFIPFDKNGTGHFPVLFLGWTLNYEMFFYVLFAIALKIHQAYRGEITAIAIFAIWWATSSVETLPLSAYGSSLVFEFVMGMMLFQILYERRLLSIAFFATIFALFCVLSPDLSNERAVMLGVPSLIFVTLFITIFRNVQIPAFITLLGGASYALYLTHPYVIQAFDKVTHWFGGSAALGFLATVTVIILTCALAVGVFWYLEEPTRKFLRATLIRP